MLSQINVVIATLSVIHSSLCFSELRIQPSHVIHLINTFRRLSLHASTDRRSSLFLPVLLLSPSNTLTIHIFFTGALQSRIPSPCDEVRLRWLSYARTHARTHARVKGSMEKISCEELEKKADTVSVMGEKSLN